MSDETLSAEEKRRILRERRQAKMAKGKATGRLNSILSQGSSVKAASVVSVLDQPKANTSSDSSIPVKSESPSEHDEDPEIQDIEAILSNKSKSNQNGQDIDLIFQNIFGATAPGNLNNDEQTNDPFTQIMKNMMKEGTGDNGDSPFNSFTSDVDSEEMQFQKDMTNYKSYQQKTWRFRFLLIRYLACLANFFYHFFTINDGSFQSSSYSFIRSLVPYTPAKSFITFFATGEIIILTSFYIISTRKNLFQIASEDSLIVKGISIGSLVVPQLEQFKPLVVRLLGYYELLGMFLGDLSLIIVLFGLLSFILI